MYCNCTVTIDHPAIGPSNIFLMTRPRANPDKLLFGIIGAVPDSGSVLSRWNAWFAKQGIDADMQRYPTMEKTLPERLSEMFHFDRRGYIVGKSLQEAIIPYLDGLDASVRGEGSGCVDTVLNDGGLLRGYFTGNDDEKRMGLWLKNF